MWCNICLSRHLYGGLPDVLVPKMYVEHSTRKVLVMEWVKVCDFIFVVLITNKYYLLQVCVSRHKVDKDATLVLVFQSLWNFTIRKDRSRVVGSVRRVRV